MATSEEPPRPRPFMERPDGLPPEEERHRDRVLVAKEIRFMRLTAAAAAISGVGLALRGYPGAGVILLIFIAGWIVTLPSHQRRQVLGQDPPADDPEPQP